MAKPSAKSDTVGSPVVQAIREKLLREFANGNYEVAEKLPSYAAWAEKFKVSIVVIQQAIEELENEGIVETQLSLRTLPSKELVKKLSTPPVRIVTFGGAGLGNIERMRRTAVRNRFRQQFCERFPNAQFDERQVE